MGAFSRLQGTMRLRLKPSVGLAGAPLLGIVFAVGWAPCMGPTLGTVAVLAMQSGSVGRAVILAFAYCIGLGLPFILAAFGFGWMTQTMTFFKRHIRVVNLIGGGLLILIGLLMVTGLWSRMMFSLQAVIGDFGTIL
jgi:cytochrome c-type biogenesis protein